jgi:hypothetical protein
MHEHGLAHVVGARIAQTRSWKVGERFFFSQHPDQLWGQPSLLIQWIQGAISPEVKWPGCEADHSPPSNAKVKNGGAIHPLPICLRGVMLNKLSTGIAFPFSLWVMYDRRDKQNFTVYCMLVVNCVL